jgi:hypothetical protein
MGFSFRKSFRVAKGTRLNIGKRGPSLSTGLGPLRFTFGPGRGGKRRSSTAAADSAGSGCLSILLGLFLLTAFGIGVLALIGSLLPDRATPNPSSSPVTPSTPVQSPPPPAPEPTRAAPTPPAESIPELQRKLTSAITTANATINQHPEMQRLKADMDKASDQAAIASPNDKVRLMDDYRAIRTTRDDLRQKLLSEDPTVAAARKALDDAYAIERSPK